MTSPDAASRPNSESRPGGICPFLGLLNDPGTYHDKPHPENHCRAVQPPEQVLTSYQESFCLVDNYTFCPLFGYHQLSTSWKEPISREDEITLENKQSAAAMERPVRVKKKPASLDEKISPPREPQPDKSFYAERAMLIGETGPRSWRTALPALRVPSMRLATTLSFLLRPWAVAAGVGGLVLLVAVYFLVIRSGFAALTGEDARNIVQVPSFMGNEPTASGTYATLAALALPEGSLTPNPSPITLTPPPPTQMPTPTPGPALETPFGPQNGFLLHKVQPGEDPESIARAYNTSEDVLNATNQPIRVYHTAEALLIDAKVRVEGASLVPGTILVIMPGQMNSEGIPRFRILFVERSVRAEDLARREGVLLKDLRLYNSLSENQEWVPTGRWVIIPQF